MPVTSDERITATITAIEAEAARYKKLYDRSWWLSNSLKFVAGVCLVVGLVFPVIPYTIASFDLIKVAHFSLVLGGALVAVNEYFRFSHNTVSYLRALVAMQTLLRGIKLQVSSLNLLAGGEPAAAELVKMLDEADRASMKITSDETNEWIKNFQESMDKLKERFELAAAESKRQMEEAEKTRQHANKTPQEIAEERAVSEAQTLNQAYQAPAANNLEIRGDLQAFKGKALQLDPDALKQVGAAIGVEEAALRAVLDVESTGSGFDDLDRPKMLFEPHVFFRNLSGDERKEAVEKGLAYEKWGSQPYPPSSYPRLGDAIKINREAALKSASWGLPQILGANFKQAGFSGVEEMVSAFMESEENQLTGMIKFMESSGCLSSLKSLDWQTFAKIYNGPSYAKFGYHKKLGVAYARWKLKLQKPGQT